MSFGHFLKTWIWKSLGLWYKNRWRCWDPAVAVPVGRDCCWASRCVSFFFPEGLGKKAGWKIFIQLEPQLTCCNCSLRIWWHCSTPKYFVVVFEAMLFHLFQLLQTSCGSGWYLRLTEFVNTRFFWKETGISTFRCMLELCSYILLWSTGSYALHFLPSENCLKPDSYFLLIPYIF